MTYLYTHLSSTLSVCLFLNPRIESDWSTKWESEKFEAEKAMGEDKEIIVSMCEPHLFV